MNQVFLNLISYFYFTNMVKFQTLFARVLLTALVLSAMVNFIYADDRVHGDINNSDGEEWNNNAFSGSLFGQQLRAVPPT